MIGDILLDDVLSKREQINEVLRVKLDEVTERWGGKVTTVEIREITPPAGRPGRHEPPALGRADTAGSHHRIGGEPAVGDQRRRGHQAGRDPAGRGDRQAAILRAEGFALAITRIYEAASQVDQKTMALQYLDAFKALGASPSTKYILPLEVTQLAEAFRGYLTEANEPGPIGPFGGGEAGGGPPAIEPGLPAGAAPETGPEGPG